jgi:hypothetical protein
VNLQPFDHATLAGSMWGLMLFATGTISAGAFYIASQRAIRRSFWSTACHLPLLMGIGIGIALNNARACLEAMMGHQSPFVRTPKYNELASASDKASKAVQFQGASEDTTDLDTAELDVIEEDVTAAAVAGTLQPTRRKWRLRAHRMMPFVELAMGLYMLECIRLALAYDRTQMSLPFLVIFAWGYFSVGIASFWQMYLRPRLGTRRCVTMAVPPAADVQDVVAKPVV